MFPTGTNPSKVNNGNTRTVFEIFSKLTRKTPAQNNWLRYRLPFFISKINSITFQEFHNFASYCSHVKSNDNKKPHCAYKTKAYGLYVNSLYAPLHWGAILMHKFISKNIIEWLLLNFFYGECELPVLMLWLGNNREIRFYYCNPLTTNVPII